jgi:hypothetical protein
MDTFLKNNYYTGKHLSAGCFKTEQVYNSAKQAQMARVLFGKGVICGFNVAAVESPSGKSYRDTIEISGGAAVDDEGRLITVDDKTTLPVAAIEGFNASKKKYTLRAVYSETKSKNTITERYVFTFNNKPKGVELAQITVENGEIMNVSDTKTLADSQLLKNWTKSTIKKQVDIEVNAIFYKYLPVFVKHIGENLRETERRVYEDIKRINNNYNTLKTKLDDLDKKLKNIEEPARPKPRSKKGRRRRFYGKHGEKQ